MSYISASLLKLELLELPEVQPDPIKLPSWYDPNAFCDWHRSPGHHTDKCMGLRHAIQDLIDEGSIHFPSSSQDNGKSS